MFNHHVLTDLVKEAAKHSIDNHEERLDQATANLVVAMTSDSLIEERDARAFQLIMENLVETGAIKLSPESREFFVSRSFPILDRSSECCRS